ncbi:unnamed protein product [Vitrella brassicaformis CCMP3155]|uniref:Uncharacterized protein n=1 Tax=Vitrella brassicaformis (strain CCMP3155) TaxID=1169540 RepID=A0A0G4G083_VITBC|nr:unnamed protein product [Vitrella brassicaformis CCMP3155]|eukprot:CEM20932.1 unnamed protein product [Vitrella brassicaformis CCMP3155]
MEIFTAPAAGASIVRCLPFHHAHTMILYHIDATDGVALHLTLVAAGSFGLLDSMAVPIDHFVESERDRDQDLVLICQLCLEEQVILVMLRTGFTVLFNAATLELQNVFRPTAFDEFDTSVLGSCVGAGAMVDRLATTFVQLDSGSIHCFSTQALLTAGGKNTAWLEIDLPHPLRTVTSILAHPTADLLFLGADGGRVGVFWCLNFPPSETDGKRRLKAREKTTLQLLNVLAFEARPVSAPKAPSDPMRDRWASSGVTCMSLWGDGGPADRAGPPHLLATGDGRGVVSVWGIAEFLLHVETTQFKPKRFGKPASVGRDLLVASSVLDQPIAGLCWHPPLCPAPSATLLALLTDGRLLWGHLVATTRAAPAAAAASAKQKPSAGPPATLQWYRTLYPLSQPPSAELAVIPTAFERFGRRGGGLLDWLSPWQVAMPVRAKEGPEAGFWRLGVVDVLQSLTHGTSFERSYTPLPCAPSVDSLLTITPHASPQLTVKPSIEAPSSFLYLSQGRIKTYSLVTGKTQTAFEHVTSGPAGGGVGLPTAATATAAAGAAGVRVLSIVDCRPRSVKAAPTHVLIGVSLEGQGGGGELWAVDRGSVLLRVKDAVDAALVGGWDGAPTGIAVLKDKKPAAPESAPPSSRIEVLPLGDQSAAASPDGEDLSFWAHDLRPTPLSGGATIAVWSRKDGSLSFLDTHRPQGGARLRSPAFTCPDDLPHAHPLVSFSWSVSTDAGDSSHSHSVGLATPRYVVVLRQDEGSKPTRWTNTVLLDMFASRSPTDRVVSLTWLLSGSVLAVATPLAVFTCDTDIPPSDAEMPTQPPLHPLLCSQLPPLIIGALPDRLLLFSYRFRQDPPDQELRTGGGASWARGIHPKGIVLARPVALLETLMRVAQRRVAVGAGRESEGEGGVLTKPTVEQLTKSFDVSYLTPRCLLPESASASGSGSASAVPPLWDSLATLVPPPQWRSDGEAVVAQAIASHRQPPSGTRRRGAGERAADPESTALAHAVGLMFGMGADVTSHAPLTKKQREQYQRIDEGAVRAVIRKLVTEDTTGTTMRALLTALVRMAGPLQEGGRERLLACIRSMRGDPEGGAADETAAQLGLRLLLPYSSLLPVDSVLEAALTHHTDPLLSPHRLASLPQPPYNMLDRVFTSRRLPLDVFGVRRDPFVEVLVRELAASGRSSSTGSLPDVAQLRTPLRPAQQTTPVLLMTREGQIAPFLPSSIKEHLGMTTPQPSARKTVATLLVSERQQGKRPSEDAAKASQAPLDDQVVIAPSPPGLLLYWRCAEGEGDTVNDSSKCGRRAAVRKALAAGQFWHEALSSGEPVEFEDEWGTGAPPGWAVTLGKGQALGLESQHGDATLDLVGGSRAAGSIAHAAAEEIEHACSRGGEEGTAGWTLEMWIRVKASPSTISPLSRDSSFRISCVLAAAGTTFTLKSSSAELSSPKGPPIPEGQWFHLAVICSDAAKSLTFRLGGSPTHDAADFCVHLPKDSGPMVEKGADLAIGGEGDAFDAAEIRVFGFCRPVGVIDEQRGRVLSCATEDAAASRFKKIKIRSQGERLKGPADTSAVIPPPPLVSFSLAPPTEKSVDAERASRRSKAAARGPRATTRRRKQMSFVSTSSKSQSSREELPVSPESRGGHEIEPIEEAEEPTTLEDVAVEMRKESTGGEEPWAIGGWDAGWPEEERQEPGPLDSFNFTQSMPAAPAVPAEPSPKENGVVTTEAPAHEPEEEESLPAFQVTEGEQREIIESIAPAEELQPDRLKRFAKEGLGLEFDHVLVGKDVIVDHPNVQALSTSVLPMVDSFLHGALEAFDARQVEKATELLQATVGALVTFVQSAGYLVVEPSDPLLPPMAAQLAPPEQIRSRFRVATNYLLVSRVLLTAQVWSAMDEPTEKVAALWVALLRVPVASRHAAAFGKQAVVMTFRQGDMAAADKIAAILLGKEYARYLSPDEGSRIEWLRGVIASQRSGTESFLSGVCPNPRCNGFLSALAWRCHSCGGRVALCSLTLRLELPEDVRRCPVCDATYSSNVISPAGGLCAYCGVGVVPRSIEQAKPLLSY